MITKQCVCVCVFFDQDQEMPQRKDRCCFFLNPCHPIFVQQDFRLIVGSQSEVLGNRCEVLDCPCMQWKVVCNSAGRCTSSKSYGDQRFDDDQFSRPYHTKYVATKLDRPLTITCGLLLNEKLINDPVIRLIL